MKTAEEIYADMKSAFETRAGREIGDDCDMAVRMYAAAAEMESLYAYGDWVKGQCFPQTATGEFLDRHAQMRGITRNGAVKAAGTLRFSVSEAAPAAVTVPVGTAVTTAAGTYFETTEAAVIAAGSLYADAAAEAREAGAAGNAEAGTAVYLTAAPVGVSACVNPAAFTGGTDKESDDDLRARVMASYGALPNGANAAYYEKTALSVDGVGAVRVLPKVRGAGTVDVIVASPAGLPTAALLTAVGNALDLRREICVDVDVSAPTAVTVNVTAAVDVEEGYIFADVKTAVENAVSGLFTGALLGENVTRARLGSVIYNVEGVKNYTLTLPAADVAADDDELPVKGTVAINAWS